MPSPFGTGAVGAPPASVFDLFKGLPPGDQVTPQQGAAKGD